MATLVFRRKRTMQIEILVFASPLVVIAVSVLYSVASPDLISKTMIVGLGLVLATIIVSMLYIDRGYSLRITDCAVLIFGGMRRRLIVEVQINDILSIGRDGSAGWGEYTLRYFPTLRLADGRCILLTFLHSDTVAENEELISALYSAIWIRKSSPPGQ